MIHTCLPTLSLSTPSSLQRKGSNASAASLEECQIAFLQIFMCRSGSAADTQNLCAYVQYYLHQHCMDLNREADVKTAAKLAKLIAYNNKVRLWTPLTW